MTLTKTLALALLAGGIAGSASADVRKDTEAFSVEFTYQANAAVEEIYSDFRRIAQRACRKETRGPIWTLAYASLLEECEQELIEKAVEKTEMPELAAYHEEQHKDR